MAGWPGKPAPPPSGFSSQQMTGIISKPTSSVWFCVLFCFFKLNILKIDLKFISAVGSSLTLTSQILEHTHSAEAQSRVPPIAATQSPFWWSCSWILTPSAAMACRLAAHSYFTRPPVRKHLVSPCYTCQRETWRNATRLSGCIS